ncbi:MAG: BamA/TamA family outer membrane protein [Acidobacteriota bacterium]
MKSPWLFVLLVIAALSGAAEPTPADDSATGPSAPSFASSSVPPDDFLIAQGAVIGDIFIRTQNIFDPSREDEDKLLFNIANRLHMTTRPRVIERKLLFASGEPFDPRLLRETARYLRSQSYLYDATVRPIRYQGNRVDIMVETRDVWTLSLGGGLQRSGGANTFQFNIEESNFLGTGRQLDVKYSDDPDRSSRRFRFVDDALFGSRAELRLWYSANSDGHRRIFDLGRPFFALDTRWAAATKVISDERQEKLYSQGEVTDRFQHERTLAEIRGGLSKGLVGGRAHRWLFGYTYDESRFRANDETHEDFVLPATRTLSYPWIGFESVEDNYIETHNLDQLMRTEDLNLGTEVRGRLGWSSDAWGGDKDQAVFAFDVRSGWRSKNAQTLLFSGHAAGRWGKGGHENITVGGEMRYFLHTFGQHRLQIALRVDAAWNLDPERQLLLGGDNGLRGYPRRFQDGDRRFLLSLEHRFYTNWELFNLVNAGAAVFVDAGRAWYASGDSGHGVLKDVGLGLRLSSSRSSKGTMVHLDVAYPLDGDTDKIQWLVTTRETF